MTKSKINPFIIENQMDIGIVETCRTIHCKRRINHIISISLVIQMLLTKLKF